VVDINGRHQAACELRRVGLQEFYSGDNGEGVPVYCYS